MKSTRFAFATVVMLSSPVAAEPIDVISAQCRQINNERTAGYVLMWLAGASSDLFRTTVHIADTEDRAIRLAAYCSRHPRIPLHEALDDLENPDE